MGCARFKSADEPRTRPASSGEKALIFVSGRLTHSGTLASISFQTATIAIDGGEELPDLVVLFLPASGEVYRDCFVAARRSGEIEVSFGVWRQSFQDSFLEPGISAAISA